MPTKLELALRSTLELPEDIILTYELFLKDVETFTKEATGGKITSFTTTVSMRDFYQRIADHWFIRGIPELSHKLSILWDGIKSLILDIENKNNINPGIPSNISKKDIDAICKLILENIDEQGVLIEGIRAEKLPGDIVKVDSNVARVLAEVGIILSSIKLSQTKLPEAIIAQIKDVQIEIKKITSSESYKYPVIEILGYVRYSLKNLENSGGVTATVIITQVLRTISQLVSIPSNNTHP